MMNYTATIESSFLHAHVWGELQNPKKIRALNQIHSLPTLWNQPISEPLSNALSPSACACLVGLAPSRRSSLVPPPAAQFDERT